MTKPIDEQKARELFTAKVPNTEAARILGVKKNTIPKIKRRLGFKVNGVRRGWGKRTQKSLAERERLEAMYGVRNDQGCRGSNNPGGIRMAQQSRAQPLNQGAHFKALMGTAQYEARRRNMVHRAEPFLPGMEACTAPNEKAELVSLVPLRKVNSETLQEPRALNIRFADLKSRQCQWFVGPITRHHAHEALCCGHETDGSAYCAAHHAKSVDRRRTEESREAA